MSVTSRSAALMFAVVVSASLASRFTPQQRGAPVPAQAQQQKLQRRLHPPADSINDSLRSVLAQIGRAHRIPEFIITSLQRSQCPWATIPEYDDQQPFVVGNNYGALISLFGCGGLEKKNPSDFSTFLLVSLVFVDPSYGSQATAPYKNLHIQEGTSFCLYLRWISGTNWDGLMTPSAGPCPMNPASGATANLQVLAIQNDEPFLDLPESVRLMPAQRGNSGYIGARCADRWCVVGTKIKDYDEKHPKKRAHPWYDFNNLGIKTTGPVRPSGKTAYATADENLESISIADLQTFQKVANVHFDPGTVPQKYADAGFVAGDNAVWMKILTPGTQPTSTSPGVMGTGEAWIINEAYPTGKRKLNVHRQVFPSGFDAPPVSRWGWNPLDEDIWVRCDLGCCTVEMT
jgi:hypothetical protein